MKVIFRLPFLVALEKKRTYVESDKLQMIPIAFKLCCSTKFFTSETSAGLV